MYYKDLCDSMIQRNEALMAELEIMLDMNENYRRNEKEFQRQIMQMHLKLQAIIDENSATVNHYEGKIRDMRVEHHEDKIETSKHYME